MPIFKVDIQIPLFRDERTPEFQEASLQESSPPTIHMDAMAFGMGCCCLQVTFQVGFISNVGCGGGGVGVGIGNMIVAVVFVVLGVSLGIVVAAMVVVVIVWH